MTDITDQDRRTAIDVAEAIERGDYPMATMWPIMARVILATVDAPDPTLAEELRDVADNYNYGMSSRAAERVDDIADRVEHELAEARAEVDHLKRDLTEAYKTRDARDDEVDRLRADVARLTTAQKGAESNAESLDPADVKPGEAWLVEYDGEKRNGVKDKEDPVPWNTVTAGGLLSPLRNTEIKLVSRLVPAPRVITDPDELDRLPHSSVILSADNDAWQKSSETSLWASTCWATINGEPSIWSSLRLCDEDHPATVLWEQEA